MAADPTRDRDPAARLQRLRDEVMAALEQRDLARDADRAGRSLSIHVEVFNTGARRLYERFGFALAEDKGVYLLLVRPPAPSGRG